MTQDNSATEWMQAFLPLGTVQDDTWELLAAGVLLVDAPTVWLVTATEPLKALHAQDLVTFVRRKEGPPTLLNLSNTQRNAGVDWLHHPCGVSATMFPVDASFAIKAFANAQCTKLRDLNPMQPAFSVGSLIGPGINRAPHDLPAVHEGVISTVDRDSGLVHATAPLLPRNAGAPLMLASPHGAMTSVAGIMLGTTVVQEADPRLIPLRLSNVITIEAALELIRSEAAAAQRKKIGGVPKPRDQEETT